jgi:small subunit ribosomal protein S13
MIQIFGKVLDSNKYVLKGLKDIYGLHKFQACLLCSKLNIGFDCKIKDLSQTQIIKLLKQIELSRLDIEINLRKNQELVLKRLIDIKSFRGLRHVKKKIRKK